MDENDDERIELYNRFCESLSKPVAERFFDEDELVELFDYAGDRKDLYVQMETLFCGSRLYPESEPLRDRRAIIYEYLSEESLKRFLADNKNSDSFMWKISNIRANSDNQTDPSIVLQQLLDSKELLNDEDVIQFCSLAVDIDRFNWLIDNIKRVEAKINYLPTLYYEIAQYAFECDDLPLSIEYHEKLTDLEPFNEEFWVTLAYRYNIANETDKCETALDYALALNPENASSLLLKAQMLIKLERFDDACSILDDLKSKYPGEIEVYRLLAHCYMNSNRISDAADVCEHVILNHDKFPNIDIFNVLDMYVDIDVTGASRYFNLLCESEDFQTADAWQQWMENLLKRDNIFAATYVCSFFEEWKHEVLCFSPLIKKLFEKQMFESVVQLFHHLNVSNPRGITPLDLFIALVSLAKMHKFKLARELSAAFLGTEIWANYYSNNAHEITELYGTMYLISDLNQKLEHPRKTDWENYDPLNMWLV